MNPRNPALLTNRQTFGPQKPRPHAKNCRKQTKTTMKYIVSQNFETLGDPCAETFATREAAEKAAAEFRAMIAAEVAEMDTPQAQSSGLGHSKDIEAWAEAHEICGWEWDCESDTPKGPAKYGREAGEYIASQAVVIEEAA